MFGWLFVFCFVCYCVLGVFGCVFCCWLSSFPVFDCFCFLLFWLVVRVLFRLLLLLGVFGRGLFVVR